MKESQKNILVVDDEPVTRELFNKKLTRWGYDVQTAENGTLALQAVAENTFDVVLTDLKMPGAVDGIGVLEGVKRQHSEIDGIVMTAYGSIENSVAAMQKGATDYLQKPVNFDELSLRLDKIIADKIQAEILLEAEKNKEQAMHALQELAVDLRRKFERVKKALTSSGTTAEEKIEKSLKILS